MSRRRAALSLGGLVQMSAVLVLLQGCRSDRVTGVDALPNAPSDVDLGQVRVGRAPISREFRIPSDTATAVVITSAELVQGDRKGFAVEQVKGEGFDQVRATYSPAGEEISEEAELVVKFSKASPPEARITLKARTLVRCDEPLAECGELCVDPRTSLDHCGACGNACAAPLHAATTCVEGRCGRGRCEAPWYDIDGSQTWGCEATCEGRVCTTETGPSPRLDAPPLAEWSMRVDALVSSGAAGSTTQTGAQHTNIGTLGQPSPLPPAGTSVLTGPSHTLVGGLNAAHSHP